jgi:hypothetical protein
MQPFDFFMLMFEEHITQSLPLTLAYLLSIIVVLPCLIHLLGYDSRQYKPGMATGGTGTRQFKEYRSACHDFDREVAAWEQAVRQKGERL